MYCQLYGKFIQPINQSIMWSYTYSYAAICSHGSVVSTHANFMFASFNLFSHIVTLASVLSYTPFLFLVHIYACRMHVAVVNTSLVDAGLVHEPWNRTSVFTSSILCTVHVVKPQVMHLDEEQWWLFSE